MELDEYVTLSSSIHGLNEADFCDLDQLEKECEEGDWTTGGRALTNQVFYNPPEQEQKVDEAGWQGGSFKLGGGGSTKSSATGAAKPVGQELSRREIMARAAEERMKRLTAASSSSSSK